MKTVITGGSGFIGSRLMEKLGAVGTYCKSPVENGIFLDITDRKQTKRLSEADIIIHTAAISHPDSSKKEEMWKVNVEGTRNITEACKPDTKLIYLSTDYVFDGRKGRYTEEDTPNPKNFYGKTKLEGEKMVSTLENYAIIRTGFVYGWHEKNQRNNFVTSIIEKSSRNEKSIAFANQYRTPTYIDDLVEGIARIISLKKRGIYNLAGPDYLDRYSIAMEVCDAFNLNKNLILKKLSTDYPHHREVPEKAGLDTTKSRKELGMKFLSLEEGLERMKILHEKQRQVSESGEFAPL